MPITEKPTGRIDSANIRQERAALQIVDLVRTKKNISGVTMGKILKNAGYSDSIQTTPSKVTKSPSFQRLMDKYLPERSLLKKHKQLSNASHLDKFIFPNSVTDEEIRQTIEEIPGAKLIKVQRNAQWARAYYMIADNRTQMDALELAYKVRKKIGGSNGMGEGEGLSGEIREVVFRIKKILPSAGT